MTVVQNRVVLLELIVGEVEEGTGEVGEELHRILLVRRMTREHKGQDNERRLEEAVVTIEEKAGRRRWQGG